MDVLDKYFDQCKSYSDLQEDEMVANLYSDLKSMDEKEVQSLSSLKEAFDLKHSLDGNHYTQRLVITIGLLLLLTLGKELTKNLELDARLFTAGLFYFGVLYGVITSYLLFTISRKSNINRTLLLIPHMYSKGMGLEYTQSLFKDTNKLLNSPNKYLPAATVVVVFLGATSQTLSYIFNF